MNILKKFTVKNLLIGFSLSALMFTACNSEVTDEGSSGGGNNSSEEINKVKSYIDQNSLGSDITQLTTGLYVRKDRQGSEDGEVSSSDTVGIYFQVKNLTGEIIYEHLAEDGEPMPFVRKNRDAGGNIFPGLINLYSDQLYLGDSLQFIGISDFFYRNFNLSSFDGFGNIEAFTPKIINIKIDSKVGKDDIVETDQKFIEEYLSSRQEFQGKEVVDLMGGIKLIFMDPDNPDGLYPKDGEKMALEYTGYLPMNDDYVFESTLDSLDTNGGRLLDSDGNPLKSYKHHVKKFNLENLIVGWMEALPLMKTGRKAVILIPSQYAYGADESRGFRAFPESYRRKLMGANHMNPNNAIPPFSVLAFEVKILALGKDAMKL
ncbi:FKBP-type peptidyl-prolyl cis-trans isomerase [Aureibacter tunicatorum]|uniref:peptidylprolyl isomerase n=1 Tax=Aureibacter tunicatorum TaxID=866807 RepID=A0AAE3XQL2_9BACT|nr:FKBP-type peptidyl-prolyl cis-trans isomerase [Aureibacter tunicatorum]MDR6241322.1 hypothetical protein [Aureibacter tunicatorum]BDD03581.1 hypothetical protein AUTU_10640 [Aureibacter tunicatorum]